MGMVGDGESLHREVAGREVAGTVTAFETMEAVMEEISLVVAEDVLGRVGGRAVGAQVGVATGGGGAAVAGLTAKDMTMLKMSTVA